VTKGKTCADADNHDPALNYSAAVVPAQAGMTTKTILSTVNY